MKTPLFLRVVNVLQGLESPGGRSIKCHATALQGVFKGLVVYRVTEFRAEVRVFLRVEAFENPRVVNVLQGLESSGGRSIKCHATAL